MEIDNDFLGKHLENDPHQSEILPHVILYIFNEKGDILLFKRRKSPFNGFWESPGGHINFGEKSVEAAKRELREETGINSNKLSFVTNFEFIIPPKFHRIGISYALKIGSKDQVKLTEHEECKWFKLNEIPKKTIPGPFDEAYKKVFGE